MKMPMCVMYAACVIVLLYLLGSAAGQTGPGITLGTEDSEPQPINMYFYSGEEGGLAVEVPEDNTTVEVECSGHPTPRMAGYYIGTWASRPVNAPVEIDRQIYCGLWTYSNEQANNVRFNVEVYANGLELFQFTTESVNLGTNPQEITGSGQSEEPIQLVQDDIISVRLAYFSDPRYGVGPGADSILIVGDPEFDTRITMTANPITLEILEPGIEGQFVMISAYINDSFASTRYYSDIRINGRTDAEAISEPTFIQEGNTTIVTWLWDFAADSAKNGEYKISITVSYNQDNEFTAVGTYDIGVQTECDDDDFIGSIGWAGWILIIIVVAICAGISYKIVSRKRASNNSK